MLPFSCLSSYLLEKKNQKPKILHCTYSLFPYRTEYDAYRSDLEYYNSAPKTEINLAKKTETEDVFNRQKLEFERLRSDVQIKLKFLDENRVINNQLIG